MLLAPALTPARVCNGRRRPVSQPAPADDVHSTETEPAWSACTNPSRVATRGGVGRSGVAGGRPSPPRRFAAALEPLAGMASSPPVSSQRVSAWVSGRSRHCAPPQQCAVHARTTSCVPSYVRSRIRLSSKMCTSIVIGAAAVLVNSAAFWVTLQYATLDFAQGGVSQNTPCVGMGSQGSTGNQCIPSFGGVGHIRSRTRRRGHLRS